MAIQRNREDICTLVLQAVEDHGGDVSRSSISQYLPDLTKAQRNIAIQTLTDRSILKEYGDKTKIFNGKPSMRISVAINHRHILRNWQPARQSFTEIRALSR
jgi:hypothetical protein